MIVSFGMHAVRLLQCAIEILETGDYHTYRPNHEELLEIRQGKLTLDELYAYLDELEIKLNGLYETSPLQYSCDFNKINNWLIDFNRRALNYNFEKGIDNDKILGI